MTSLLKRPPRWEIRPAREHRLCTRFRAPAGLVGMWIVCWLPWMPATVAAQEVPPVAPVEEAVNPVHERWKMEADRAYRLGQYDRTVELTSAVLAQNPRDHVAYYLRASARVEIGRSRGDAAAIRAGLADAREAIRYDGGKQVDYYLPYLYGMSGLAEIENRPAHAKVAVEWADRVLARSELEPPRRANFLYQRGLAHRAMGEFDKAADDFRNALKVSPGHLASALALPETFAAAGQTEKALAAFRDAAESFPSEPLVHNNRGMYLQQLGRLDEAIAAFTQAIRLDPESAAYAYLNRGYAYAEQGNHEAAERDFSRAVAINPQQPELYEARGLARLDRGDVAKALEDFRTLLRVAPNDPLAHSQLGFAEFFAGDYAAAAREFDEAVRRDAQLRYLDPWRYWSRVRAGRKAEADQTFAQVRNTPAEQRNWTDWLLLFLLGDVSEEQLLKAVTTQDAEAAKAQRCEAHFFIAEVRRAAGDAKGAAEHDRAALATGAKHLHAYRGSRLALARAAEQPSP